MDSKELSKLLKAPFDAKDIDWKIQYTNNEKTSGFAVPFVDNRAIQNRLDDAAGLKNWKNEYVLWRDEKLRNDKELHKESQLCGIGIYFEERNEWVFKYDGAENTDFEAIKGGLSDSMKRAATLWGIGRYLYDMEGVWVNIEQKGKSSYIKKDQFSKLNEHYSKATAALFGGKSVKPSSNSTDSTNSSDVPKYQYVIHKIEGSSKSPTKCLHLIDNQGEIIQAYIREDKPDIKQGVYLNNVKFGVIQGSFNNAKTLDAYEVAPAA